MANQIPLDRDTLLARDRGADSGGLSREVGDTWTKACRGGEPDFKIVWHPPLGLLGDALA
jgi:hypothetical protein